MPGSVRNAILDPQFKSFSPTEQRAILEQLDPDIKGVSDAELPQVLSQIAGSHGSGPGRFPAGGYGSPQPMPRPEGSLANPTSAMEQGVYDTFHGHPVEGPAEAGLGAAEAYGISSLPAAITGAVDAVASGTVGSLLKRGFVRLLAAGAGGKTAHSLATHLGASPGVAGLAGVAGAGISGWLGDIPGAALKNPASLIRWAATQAKDDPIAKSIIEEATATRGNPVPVGTYAPPGTTGVLSEPGPGYSGTKLPAPTGKGSNPVSPPTIIRSHQSAPPEYGGGNPADYIAQPPDDQYRIGPGGTIIAPSDIQGTPVRITPGQPGSYPRAVPGRQQGVPGPGFSGTSLPGATGLGSNSQTPPIPIRPQGLASPPDYGGGNPSSYVATGSPDAPNIIQPVVTGGGKTPQAAGPTPSVPTKPTVAPSPVSAPTPGSGPVGGTVLSDEDQAALKLGKPIIEAGKAKSLKIAQYWRDKRIDPSSVTPEDYAAHETANNFGHSKPANVQASIDRTRAAYSQLPAATTPTPASNDGGTNSLEDTLKKSITNKQGTTPGVKARKATSPAPTPAVPTLPVNVPSSEGVFTYGGANPYQEFKRSGGSWFQRPYGSSDAFSPVNESLKIDLEDGLNTGELKKK